MGTRDIGVRMALGATRGSVFALVLRRVALLLAGGLAVGVALTFAVHRAIAAVVDFRFVHQAGLLSVLVVTMAAAGLAAALLPMRRAASIEPMQALRSE
jgi:ABC-type antimicrobial peptide transport system permease subunit